VHELRKYLTVVNVRRRGRNGVNDAGLCVDADVRFGEWREGIAPSRSPRTVREPLDSYGSHHPTAGSIAQCEKRLG